jgi:transposase
MKSLSMDLRDRIVAAYEANEGSYAVLAARFSVSRAVVGKLVRQKRRLGTLETQVHLRGRKRLIAGKKEEQLLKHVRQKPDATLRERIEELELNCCVNTMWQSLNRLGQSFKKSQRVQPNRTAKTLHSSE